MQEKIKAEMKAAMLAKDTTRLQTLRMLSAAFTNELVSQGRPPQELLSDEDCIKVVKRLVKQRKDSIEQYSGAGRPELAEEETAELKVLEEFLPAQITESEIEARVKAKLEENPIDASKKGQFVGELMREFEGNADGNLVKDVVNRLIP